MKGGTTMINIRSIIKLAEGDGFTLKAGKKIQYKPVIKSLLKESKPRMRESQLTL